MLDFVDFELEFECKCVSAVVGVGCCLCLCCDEWVAGDPRPLIFSKNIVSFRWVSFRVFVDVILDVLNALLL